MLLEISDKDTPGLVLTRGGGPMDANMEVLIGPYRLAGNFAVPAQAAGLVIFAHGSGSGRYSPRNVHVAQRLQARNFATLLLDLLTEAESEDGSNVFDIPLLAGRVAEAIDWADNEHRCSALPVCLFGASTGAGAALMAAAAVPERICAIVSRGGRPDLAGRALSIVHAPTLMIVGSLDRDVLLLNEKARAQMRCETKLAIVPGAGHLFAEPGALDQVIYLTADWFSHHLAEARHGRRSIS
jgi:pimeloyl-ACP methyl ester carboxylesterase